MLRKLLVLCVCVHLWAAWLAADVVTDWNSFGLDAIRTGNTPPTAASRNLAILHVAIYDAVNGVHRSHRPYFVTQTAPANTSAEAAAATAGYDVLAALYPALQPELQAHYQDSLDQVLNGSAKVQGIEWGRFVAAQILQLRSNDGSSNTVVYIPGTQPGQWRPTISFGGVVRPALAPHWGSVVPFALASGSQFRPPAPPPLLSARYAAEVNFVKSIGKLDSVTRTEEQTEIGVFWGYGPNTATPPGHWNQIAQAVLQSRPAKPDSIERNARLFALLNIAMADAAIVSWDAKYTYNLWRPITAIQEADTDGNAATDPDPDWMPLLPTPPFPEYTSGHSTFSGAAAVVLAYFFGSDRVRFTVGSDDLPGVLRSYRSFSEAALESGMSRLYAGIHFPSANFYGLTTGAAVGAYTAFKVLTPIWWRN